MIEVDENGQQHDRPTHEVLDPFRGVDLRALEHSLRRPRTKPSNSRIPSKTSNWTWRTSFPSSRTVIPPWPSTRLSSANKLSQGVAHDRFNA